jgi:hypothetical protein
VGRVLSATSDRVEPLALASTALLFAGLVLVSVIPRVAGYVLIAGLAVRIAAHVLTGIGRYRAAMSRPWPAVAPVADDDW